jgi:hypothetical protein
MESTAEIAAGCQEIGPSRPRKPIAKPHAHAVAAATRHAAVAKPIRSNLDLEVRPDSAPISPSPARAGLFCQNKLNYGLAGGKIFQAGKPVKRRFVELAL